MFEVSLVYMAVPGQPDDLVRPSLKTKEKNYHQRCGLNSSRNKCSFIVSCHSMSFKTTAASKHHSGERRPLAGEVIDTE